MIRYKIYKFFDIENLYYKDMLDKCISKVVFLCSTSLKYKICNLINNIKLVEYETMDIKNKFRLIVSILFLYVGKSNLNKLNDDVYKYIDDKNEIGYEFISASILKSLVIENRWENNQLFEPIYLSILYHNMKYENIGILNFLDKNNVIPLLEKIIKIKNKQNIKISENKYKYPKFPIDIYIYSKLENDSNQIISNIKLLFENNLQFKINPITKLQINDLINKQKPSNIQQQQIINKNHNTFSNNNNLKNFKNKRFKPPEFEEQTGTKKISKRLKIISCSDLYESDIDLDLNYKFIISYLYNFSDNFIYVSQSQLINFISFIYNIFN